MIAQSRVALASVIEPADFLTVEAAAASAYWSTWQHVEPRWAKKDAARVPEHWRRFDARASKLTGNPRLATDPVNAVANLLSALGETEARWACLAQGLDPGIGLLHRDQRSRDSLALDLLEVVRPDYEEWLLDWIERRALRIRDFVEGTRGQVSISASLVPEIVETSPVWGARIAPVVEWVAQALMTGEGVTVPTRLTQARRSAGRARLRKARPKARVSGAVSPTIPRACRHCGEPTTGQRRVCDTCLPDERVDATRRLTGAGRTTLRERHARGAHPGLTAEANAKRGRTVSRARKAGSVWERKHSRRWDRTEFTDEILPGLQGLSAGQVARAVRISTGYASQILKGQRVPHPRLWEELRRVAER